MEKRSINFLRKTSLIKELTFPRKVKSKSMKGQSAIVSSVLLILIVIVAIGLIMGFVIPFVKDKLSSGDCLDVAAKVEISGAYTCYNSTGSSGNMQVQVKIKDISDLIEGYTVELGGSSSDSFKIINGTDGTEINAKMCDQTTDLIVPNKDNVERTYVFEGVDRPNVIRVYPTLKGGKSCDVSDSLSISLDSECSTSQICP